MVLIIASFKPSHGKVQHKLVILKKQDYIARITNMIITGPYIKSKMNPQCKMIRKATKRINNSKLKIKEQC